MPETGVPVPAPPEHGLCDGVAGHGPRTVTPNPKGLRRRVQRQPVAPSGVPPGTTGERQTGHPSDGRTVVTHPRAALPTGLAGLSAAQTRGNRPTPTPLAGRRGNPAIWWLCLYLGLELSLRLLYPCFTPRVGACHVTRAAR